MMERRLRDDLKWAACILAGVTAGYFVFDADEPGLLVGSSIGCAVVVVVLVLLALLGDVCDQGFVGEEQAGDTGAVLQGTAGHLHGIDNAGLDEVDELLARGIEAGVAAAVQHSIDDDSAIRC